MSNDTNPNSSKPAAAQKRGSLTHVPSSPDERRNDPVGTTESCPSANWPNPQWFEELAQLRQKLQAEAILLIDQGLLPDTGVFTHDRAANADRHLQNRPKPDLKALSDSCILNWPQMPYPLD